MKVNRSAFYAYLSRRSYQASSPETSRAAAVKECFEFHRRSWRIAADRGRAEDWADDGAESDAARRVAGDSTEGFCAAND